MKNYTGVIIDALPFITEKNMFQVKLKVKMISGKIVEALLNNVGKAAIFPVDYFTGKKSENEIKVFLKTTKIQADRFLKGRKIIVIHETALFPLWEHLIISPE